MVAGSAYLFGNMSFRPQLIGMFVLGFHMEPHTGKWVIVVIRTAVSRWHQHERRGPAYFERKCPPSFCHRVNRHSKACFACMGCFLSKCQHKQKGNCRERLGPSQVQLPLPSRDTTYQVNCRNQYQDCRFHHFHLSNYYPWATRFESNGRPSRNVS